MGELHVPGATVTSVLVGGALSLSLMWWLSTRRRPRMPPGPGPALPFIGHLHLLKPDPRKQFREWRKQYGDVFALYLGGRMVVVLNGLDAIRESLVKMADVFSHRPTNMFMFRLSEHKGIASSMGPLWKKQRKTGLEILREFGMGKNLLADRVLHEIDFYVKAIADHQGAPVDLANLTQVSISNNICAIVFGHRFDYDDKDFQGYLSIMNRNLKAIGAAAVVNYLPILEYLPGDPLGTRAIETRAKVVYDFFQREIDAHKQEREQDPTTADSDFIYAYLSHAEKPDAQIELNNMHLLQTVADLFAAGTETTATAIRWALLMFLHHPHVQDKCFKEAQDVIGSGRPPRMEDRTKLVYLEATIFEVLRVGNIAPFALPHGLAEDVKFRDFVLPADAIVLPNLDSVMHDPEVWGDPEVFRPERFIAPDGTLARREEFVAFSLGRRVCLGEALARMELFLYLATLVQRFQFLPPEDGHLPGLDGVMGVTLSPQLFKVRAVPRL